MRGSSREYGCPHCGSTAGFTEADIVRASACVLAFDTEGEPQYGGESDVDWDSQDLDPNEKEPFGCDACGKSFVKPIPISGKTKRKRPVRR